MKRLSLATLPLLFVAAACSTQQDAASEVRAEHTAETSLATDPSWFSVSSGTFASGGSTGGLLALQYPMTASRIDQVAVTFPTGCGVADGWVKVAAPGQILEPTRYSDHEKIGSERVWYYAVNGEGSATVTRIDLTLQMSAFGSCWPVNVWAHRALPFNPNIMVAGYDFEGFKTLPPLPANQGCTMQANPVTDACLARGGSTKIAKGCAVLCSLPLN